MGDRAGVGGGGGAIGQQGGGAFQGVGRGAATQRDHDLFIEPPRAMVEAVIAKHAIVKQLIEHRWLFLFRIDPDTDGVEECASGGWRARAERTVPAP